jgi:hypothetical protein
MRNDLIKAESQADLRLRALQRLTGNNGSHDARLNGSAAFQVLHDLASSPSTGAAALALLHELQVYQVELDLQDEELRRSRAELEAALTRQDGAPTKVGELQLLSGRGAPRRVHVSANRDPDGQGFLIAFVDVAGHGERPTV